MSESEQKLKIEILRANIDVLKEEYQEKLQWARQNSEQSEELDITQRFFQLLGDLQSKLDHLMSKSMAEVTQVLELASGDLNDIDESELIKLPTLPEMVEV
jgi:hypothetical protein